MVCFGVSSCEEVFVAIRLVEEHLFLNLLIPSPRVDIWLLKCKKKKRKDDNILFIMTINLSHNITTNDCN